MRETKFNTHNVQKTVPKKKPKNPINTSSKKMTTPRIHGQELVEVFRRVAEKKNCKKVYHAQFLAALRGIHMDRPVAPSRGLFEYMFTKDKVKCSNGGPRLRLIVRDSQLDEEWDTFWSANSNYIVVPIFLTLFYRRKLKIQYKSRLANGKWIFLKIHEGSSEKKKASPEDTSQEERSQEVTSREVTSREVTSQEVTSREETSREDISQKETSQETTIQGTIQNIIQNTIEEVIQETRDASTQTSEESCESNQDGETISSLLSLGFRDGDVLVVKGHPRPRMFAALRLFLEKEGTPIRRCSSLIARPAETVAPSSSSSMEKRERLLLRYAKKREREQRKHTKGKSLQNSSRGTKNRSESSSEGKSKQQEEHVEKAYREAIASMTNQMEKDLCARRERLAAAEKADQENMQKRAIHREGVSRRTPKCSKQDGKHSTPNPNLATNLPTILETNDVLTTTTNAVIQVGTFRFYLVPFNEECRFWTSLQCPKKMLSHPEPFESILLRTRRILSGQNKGDGLKRLTLRSTSMRKKFAVYEIRNQNSDLRPWAALMTFKQLTVELQEALLCASTAAHETIRQRDRFLISEHVSRHANLTRDVCMFLLKLEEE